MKKLKNRKPMSRISQERRTALIKSTIVTIAELGLKSASIEKITERAGVSRGLIRYYFRNKAELLQAVYRFITLEFQLQLENVSSNASTLQKLNQWIDQTFDPPYATPEMFSAWTSLTEASRTDPTLSELASEANMLYQQHLSPLFQSILGNSVHHSELKRIVDGFIVLTDGLWFNLCAAPERFSPDYAKKICRDYVSRLIGK